MFRKLFHPKQNQDPTLYEKSWGVFRMGRISARAILIVGTILVFLFSNWAGNALQAILVALFSSNFGFFSGHGLAYTLHFLSIGLINPNAFFGSEDLIGLLSIFQRYTWLPQAIHWIGFALTWYLFVWRPFIHIWTKSRNLNHHENGMSRVATPTEIRWQTYKVPDRTYEYSHHPGFPVMHTFNWRGKLNHMIKTEKGATQSTLHISNYEVGRLYVYSIIFVAVIAFLIVGSLTWGEISYRTTGSAPVISLFQVTHPIAIIIGWLVMIFFKLIAVFGKMQVVGIHYPFTGGLFYLTELLAIGWIIAHIKDVRRHYKNGMFNAILHDHFFHQVHVWYEGTKQRKSDLANGHKPQHVNNAADDDVALQNYYYNDKNSDVKVIDCFFHHPVKTIKLAYMAVMSVLVNLDAGTTGWYYLSPRPHNVWIYGTSGSGKGQMVVNPSMDINSRADPKDRPNMIVTDPKGESAAGASVMLKKRGYNVKVMNMLDLSHSMSFNPLRLVIKYAQLGAVGQAEDSCSQLSYTIYDPSGQGSNSYFYTSAASLFDAMTFALIGLAHSRYYGLNSIVTYKGHNVCDDGQYKKGNAIDSAGHHVQLLHDKKYHSDTNAFDKVTIRNISEMVAQLGGQEGSENGQDPEKQLMIYFDHLSQELSHLRNESHEAGESFPDVKADQLAILDQAVQKFQQSKLAGSKTAGSIYSTFLDKLRIYMSSDVAKMTSMDNFNPAEMGFDRLLTLQFSRKFKLQHITTKSWHAIENTKTGKPMKVIKRVFNAKNLKKDTYALPIDNNLNPIVNRDGQVINSKGVVLPSNSSAARNRIKDYVEATDTNKKAYNHRLSGQMSYGYTRKPIGHIETNKGHLSEIGVGHIPFEKPITGKIFFVTIDLYDERVGRHFKFVFLCDKKHYTPKVYEKIRNDYKRAPQVADMEAVYAKKGSNGKLITTKKVDVVKGGHHYMSTEPLTAQDKYKDDSIKHIVINKYTHKKALRYVSVDMTKYPGKNEYDSLPKSSTLRSLSSDPKSVFIKEQAHFLYNPHPTAWFIVAPQNKQELNQLGTFAIGQTFNMLSGISMSFTNGRHVQRPLQMILDELGNLPAIRHLDRMASFGRSQHIYIMPIFQAREQADQIYKKDVTNVVYSNCPTTVYILSNSEDTIKEISAGFGNRSVTNTTRSYDPAKISSINYNENEMKQAVMPPDVLRNLRLGEAAILRTTDRTNVWGQNNNPWPIFDWDGYRDQANGKLKKLGPNHILPYSWWFLSFSHGSLSSVPIVTPHKYLDLESLTIQFNKIYLWMEENNPLDTTVVGKVSDKIKSKLQAWEGTGYYDYFALELARANDANSKNNDTKKALSIMSKIQDQMKRDKSLLHLNKAMQMGEFMLSVIAQHQDLNLLSKVSYIPSLQFNYIYGELNVMGRKLFEKSPQTLMAFMHLKDDTLMGRYGAHFDSINSAVNGYLNNVGLINAKDGNNALTSKAKKLIENTDNIHQILASENIDYNPQVPLSKLLTKAINGLRTSYPQYRGLLFLMRLVNPAMVKGFTTGVDNVEYAISINMYIGVMMGLIDVLVGRLNTKHANDKITSPLNVSDAYGDLLKELNNVNNNVGNAFGAK